MSRGSQIYNIINTLSRGEKRQFKVQSAKYEKEDKNITSKLFDVIEGLNSWDESSFKTKVQHAGIDKYIAVHSNNLLSQLLESLRIKQVKSNTLFKINNLVESSMLLFERNELELALSRLKKAKLLARQSEYFEKYIEILFRERETQVRSMGTLEYKDYRVAYFEEVKDAIQQLDNKVEYFNLVEEIFHVYRTIGHPQKEIEKSQYGKIMASPLLKDISNALSAHAKISYHYVHYMYSLGLHDLPKACDAALRQVEVFESNRDFTIANISTHIAVLNNLAVAQSQLDNSEEFMTSIEKMRSIPEKYSIESTFVRQQIFELSYNEEMDFYLIRGRLDEMNGIVSFVESEMDKMEAERMSLNPFLLNLAIRLAIYYLRTGDIERSHLWVKKVMNEEGRRSTVHIHTYAIILDLILHYRSGDFEYLAYRLNNVQKHFRKTQQMNPANELFLSILRDLSRISEPEQADAILKNFLVEFNKLPDSLEKLIYNKFIDIDKTLKPWSENPES